MKGSGYPHKVVVNYPGQMDTYTELRVPYWPLKVPYWVTTVSRGRIEVLTQVPIKRYQFLVSSFTTREEFLGACENLVGLHPLDFAYKHELVDPQREDGLGDHWLRAKEGLNIPYEFFFPRAGGEGVVLTELQVSSDRSDGYSGLLSRFSNKKAFLAALENKQGEHPLIFADENQHVDYFEMLAKINRHNRHNRQYGQRVG